MDVARELNLTAVLADHRERRATSLAVVDGRTRLTYRDLDDRVGALAGALRALGLGVGDRLLWLGGGSFRLLECLLATARVGAVTCPVAAWRSEEELGGIVADCGPSVLLCGGEHVGSVEAYLGTARGAAVIRHDVADGYEALLRSCGSPAEDLTVSGNGPALMLYTPIIAGRLVGVQVSRAALIAESVEVALRNNTELAHRPVAMGNMDHIGSVVAALAAILVGTTVDISTVSTARTSLVSATCLSESVAAVHADLEVGHVEDQPGRH